MGMVTPEDGLNHSCPMNARCLCRERAVAEKLVLLISMLCPASSSVTAGCGWLISCPVKTSSRKTFLIGRKMALPWPAKSWWQTNTVVSGFLQGSAEALCCLFWPPLLGRDTLHGFF